MYLAAIFVAVAWLPVSGASGASSPALLQTAPAQQASKPDAPPASAKPCPTAPPSAPAAQPDCTPAAKNQPAATGPASGPTKKAMHKKVVPDGGTIDPATDISPGVSQQQASQQGGRTTWLLARTDENLKTVANRQLNAAQQDTVNQIKSYVKQSKKASEDGDLQRAYTLANKARMLSGDLVKH